MIYKGKEILHGKFAIPIGCAKDTFIVSASQKGWRKQFVVIATDADDAIARLKSNAIAMIDEVIASLKPEDFVHVVGMLGGDASLVVTSKFEMIVHPMRELLDEKTELSAKKLSSTRCYTASYFDDFRSYTSYCD
jgi:hypothetical protein